MVGGYELNFEYGYRLYNKLISLISNNNQAITIANSLLIMILLNRLINNHSPYVFLSIWLYVTLGIYQTQMNMARNAIAIFICYISCEYIEKGNIKKFVGLIIIASLFHISSILFMPMYWLVRNVKLTKSRIKKLLVASVCFGVGFSLVRPILVNYLPFGFGRYFIGNTSKYESLIIGVFHLCLLISIVMFIEKQKRKSIFENEIIGSWMFILEMFFFCIGFDVSSATRMAALFGPYLIVFIPCLIDKGIESENVRFNVIFLVVILTGVQYIIRLQINNIGSTLPYRFFWG